MNIQSLGGFAQARYDEQRLATAESSPASRPSQARPAQPDAAPTPPAAQPAEPSPELLAAAVEKLNQSMPATAHSLEFSIDESSQQTVVKIVDQSTKEVVRQIPSAEALDIAKALDQAMGRLIKATA